MSLFPVNIPGENVQEREKTEERGRGGPNVGRKQVSNCWQNVKSPEQFSFPIYCDASSPELKRPAYISKQLKIIFSNTVPKAKKDISKISLNLWSLNDQLISLWATHFTSCTLQSISRINIFWENDVSLWTSLPARSWKNQSAWWLSHRPVKQLHLSCFGFDAECFRDCTSQKDQNIKDSSLAACHLWNEWGFWYGLSTKADIEGLSPSCTSVSHLFNWACQYLYRVFLRF